MEGFTRGHLSRSACRHVKQRAKRSGRIQNRRLVSSPSGAVGAEDLNDDEPAKIPRSQDAEARDAIDPWRIAALQLRGDVGSSVSHPGLSLRHDGACRRRASRATIRASSIRASPIRRSRCSSSGWRSSRAPRRRARPRAEWPRSPPRSWASSRPATTSSPRGRCSARASMWSRSCCRASASPRPWSTARISTPGGRLCARTPRRRSSNRRPIRRSNSSTSPASPRSCMGPARRSVVDNVFATPLLQHPMKLGADCVVYSATKHIDGQGRVLGGVILAKREIHRRPHPQFPAPDRPLSFAVQRLDAAEVARDPAGARRRADAQRGQNRGFPQPASRGSSARSIRAAPIIRRRRSRKRQMEGGGTIVAFEVAGGKAAAFRVANALIDHRHLQQSRRRQEPHHPSGDDDPSAAQARAAGGARHRAGPAPIVGRPRGRRRSDRGSGPGARQGVAAAPARRGVGCGPYRHFYRPP